MVLFHICPLLVGIPQNNFPLVVDNEHSYICHWLYDASGTKLVRAIGT